MRIVIFDGILEHHLHESLERALLARGHEVLATGKIGHGFRFPPHGSPAPNLEHAVASALEFAPDWVLVMRPASLPPHLLRRLRRGGARLTAWFSDDPVLFDLSYAPVLEQYDRILHCGTSAVLAFYERYFGRPTGVNLPFWTDHQAFPAVWGTEPPETRALFLGNVHDAVRRRRYFDLSRFGGDIRIHGKVGSDYARIGGGYLDTDAEVIAAGARTDWAVNIPQWFRDHRGMETWFPELDELGFFEFPSRVVQTMAMGVPTVSIIDGGHDFATYPEMLVARTVDDAIDIVRDTSWDADRLSELSTAVLRRFDRHFSAASRAIAIEHFLQDDAWIELDAAARTRWFADIVDVQADIPSVEERRASPVSLNPFRRDSDSLPRRVLLAMPHDSRPVSRAQAVLEALDELGVETEIIATDESGLWDALAAPKLSQLDADDAVLVVDLPVAVPATVRAALGARSVLIADLPVLSSRSAAIAASYDLVATADAAIADRFREAGFSNVVQLARVVVPSFACALAARSATASGRAVRIAESAADEDRLVPGLASMLTQAGLPLLTWSELATMDPVSLAEAVASQTAVVSPRGTKSAPLLDDLFVHVRAATGRAFVPRSAGLTQMPGLVDATPQFASTSELGRKLWRLDDSPTWAASIDAAIDRLRTATDATSAVAGLLRRSGPAATRALHLASDGPLLDSSARCDVRLDAVGWEPRAIVRAVVRTHAGEPSEMAATLLDGDTAIWTGQVQDELLLAIGAPRSARSRLTIRFEHRGAPRVLSTAAAYAIHVGLVDTLLPVPLDVSRIEVLELQPLSN